MVEIQQVCLNNNFLLLTLKFRSGLGGIGGPYRLDSGHQVFQVPDDVKAAVPDHIRKAARELGQKVFKERLKEIEMSEYEHETYEKYLNKIASEIKMLRSIIESLEAKSHDRQWVVSLSNPLFRFVSFRLSIELDLI